MSTAEPVKFGEKFPRSSSSKRSSRERTTTQVERVENLKEGEGKETVSTLVPSTVVKREVNRCLGCRRKVGLIGFRCRCGELFFSKHRYSDCHDDSYDYKFADGRRLLGRIRWSKPRS
ncbi:hypothetical protein ACH5RR_000748 [Cinchona calisaya]|uniref:AN1-type domain-containing protein n=1 Tax=Cinchona calisaya TaxID=153742 RepID=A0ABD3B1G4_9GENT